MMTAACLIRLSASIWLSSVVLPEPRNLVSSVTGMVVCRATEILPMKRRWKRESLRQWLQAFVSLYRYDSCGREFQRHKRLSLLRQAVRAGAAHLDGGLGKLEAVVVRPALEAIVDRGVRKFVDLAAVLADREGDNAVLVPMRVLVRVGAGDEGVEAFQPVDQAHVDQLFQRTIDLKWRAKTVLAQLVEQRIRAGGPLHPRKRVQHQRLVLRQIVQLSHRWRSGSLAMSQLG